MKELLPFRRLTPVDLPKDAVALAQALIGKSLIHDHQDGTAAIRVVETEAYPVGDPAGWAFHGKTAHNAPLFQGFGHIHVYLSYGVSWLTNIAADAGDGGAGVLFRAGEPLWGLGAMIDRRGPRRVVDLANGPGKLSAALGIDRRHDGGDFFDGGPLWIGDAIRPTRKIVTSRRIGISKAVDEPLRFYEADNPYVSGPRDGGHYNHR